jgi:hypothetical protein
VEALCSVVEWWDLSISQLFFVDETSCSCFICSKLFNSMLQVLYTY